MEPGKFYLVCAPFFMTFVGRYVKHLNFQEFVMDNCLYFTVTGATFDILTHEGMQEKSKYHVVGDGIIIPSQGPKFPWHAKTPWAK
jgi:hypothetical protein